MDIVIIGGGGHAKVVMSVIGKLPHYRILGYTDLEDRGAWAGVAYLGPDTVLTAAVGRGACCAVLGIGQLGSGELRSRLWDKLHTTGLRFPPIVSPDAVVNAGVDCADGVVVMDGAVVNTGAKIGRGAIVNTNSTVEHDVRLADWVHVAPGATVCGDVSIGAFSMIGAGATVIQGRTVGPGCFVGAGATVLRDLREPGIYVGTPARKIG